MLLSPGDFSISISRTWPLAGRGDSAFSGGNHPAFDRGLRGNMTLAAARLGLHRSNLYRKMRQLGMEEG